jgi:hypothetical protein
LHRHGRRIAVVFLCEISFAAALSDLAKRLLAWNSNWHALRRALARDLFVDASWPVSPWVFIPQERIVTLERKLAKTYGEFAATADGMPYPKITALEDVVPWKYRAFNRAPDQE